MILAKVSSNRTRTSIASIPRITLGITRRFQTGESRTQFTFQVAMFHALRMRLVYLRARDAIGIVYIRTQQRENRVLHQIAWKY
jgi:hypothetical protein